MSGHSIADCKYPDKAVMWSNTCQYKYDSCNICDTCAAPSAKKQYGHGNVRVFHGKRYTMAYQTACMD